MGKKPDLNELRLGFGLARGLGDEFIQAIERNTVPIEAVRRLVTPQGRSTVDAIAQRILTDWQAEQPAISVPDQPPVASLAVEPQTAELQQNQLANDEEVAEEDRRFPVMVYYEQPSCLELQRRFPALTDPRFEENKKFRPITSCENVSRENRVVTFQYTRVMPFPDHKYILDIINRRGLRPALYEELLSFAELYPNEQKKFPIAALGSTLYINGGLDNAYLWWYHPGGAHLGLHWLSDFWSDYCRFLVTSKR